MSGKRFLHLESLPRDQERAAYESRLRLMERDVKEALADREWLLRAIREAAHNGRTVGGVSVATLNSRRGAALVQLRSIADRIDPPARPPMTRNVPGERCPECRAEEVDSNSPRTKYACGSTDYDQRPGTFRKGESCSGEIDPPTGDDA